MARNGMARGCKSVWDYLLFEVLSYYVSLCQILSAVLGIILLVVMYTTPFISVEINCINVFNTAWACITYFLFGITGILGVLVLRTEKKSCTLVHLILSVQSAFVGVIWVCFGAAYFLQTSPEKRSGIATALSVLFLVGFVCSVFGSCWSWKYLLRQVSSPEELKREDSKTKAKALQKYPKATE